MHFENVFTDRSRPLKSLGEVAVLGALDKCISKLRLMDFHEALWTELQSHQPAPFGTHPILPKLSNITTLELDGSSISTFRWPEKGVRLHRFIQFLAAMPLLRELSMGRLVMMDFSSVFASVSWDNLETLRIEQCSVHPAFLGGFLARHSSTLRTFHMKSCNRCPYPVNIRSLRTKHPSTVQDLLLAERKILQTPSHPYCVWDWIPFFREIPQLLKLSEAHVAWMFPYIWEMQHLLPHELLAKDLEKAHLSQYVIQYAFEAQLSLYFIQQGNGVGLPVWGEPLVLEQEYDAENLNPSKLPQ